MRNVLLPLLLGALTVACASHEGALGEKQPEPNTKEARPQIALRAAIASVSIVRDCPDPPPSPAPAQPAAAAEAPAAAPTEMAKPTASMDVAPGAVARRRAGDSPDGGWSPPCQQSTMQLTLAHDAKEAQGLSIKAARLTAAGTGAELGAVPVRGPTRWDDAGRYVDWDEKLPGGAELKVSYRLGDPDWAQVSKALGSEDTYGKRYVLEVDVAFDGRVITLRSPEFQREYEHVVVT